mmetsp:Transcript_36918/g.92587  ORF Transcript_36918/g.92587 Transcript_36918/m.92587 type:complete len:271 (+) Transcript_36918:658-1470(+)
MQRAVFLFSFMYTRPRHARRQSTHPSIHPCHSAIHPFAHPINIHTRPMLPSLLHAMSDRLSVSLCVSPHMHTQSRSLRVRALSARRPAHPSTLSRKNSRFHGGATGIYTHTYTYINTHQYTYIWVYARHGTHTCEYDSRSVGLQVVSVFALHLPDDAAAVTDALTTLDQSSLHLVEDLAARSAVEELAVGPLQQLPHSGAVLSYLVVYVDLLLGVVPREGVEGGRHAAVLDVLLTHEVLGRVPTPVHQHKVARQTPVLPFLQERSDRREA